MPVYLYLNILISDSSNISIILTFYTCYTQDHLTIPTVYIINGFKHTPNYLACIWRARIYISSEKKCQRHRSSWRRKEETVCLSYCLIKLKRLKQALFRALCSGISNKIKQVECQKMTESANAVGPEPHTLEELKKSDNKCISGHSDGLWVPWGGEGIPALSLLNERSSSCARTSVRSLKTRSHLNCILQMSYSNAKAAVVSCGTFITHGYSP